MIRRACREGFTLIEALVIVAVIGMVTALLLPAVQRAREAARRLHCSNNLRNIGLAIQNHVETHNKFPSGVGTLPADTSYLVQILPYLEQDALFNSINVTDGVETDANLTAFRNPPGLFICPSDASRASIDTVGAVNYAGNAGRSLMNGEGVFINRFLKPQDIRDGLSRTAGVAEWIVGPGIGKGARQNTSKYGLSRVYTDSPEDIEGFTRACESLEDVDPKFLFPSKGQFWLAGGLSTTLYNHMLRPNRPSCKADLSMDATTSGSYHFAGANVLMMDGGVHYVKDSINPRVWSAWGSRAGGEIGSAL